jgi:hypothetical protein
VLFVPVEYYEADYWDAGGAEWRVRYEVRALAPAVHEQYRHYGYDHPREGRLARPQCRRLLFAMVYGALQMPGGDAWPSSR